MKRGASWDTIRSSSGSDLCPASAIPTDHHSHPLKFTQLQATCDAYKFSVWSGKIKDWNSLHVDIIKSNSIHCFKKALGFALIRAN